MFSILELVTCFTTGGPRLYRLTMTHMSQGATRKKSLGTTGLGGHVPPSPPPPRIRACLSTQEIV